MKTRSLSVVCIAAMLAGCATAKPVPLPNGQQGFAIEDCDDMAECYKKAAEACGGKYEIVGQGSGSVGTITSTGGVIVPQYSMTVACTSGGDSAPK